MHKFRGSFCLSHSSQSEDVFQSYYHLSKLWSICYHQLPKRGRKCIDHRLRERVLLLFSLVYLVVELCYLLVCLILYAFCEILGWSCVWSYATLMLVGWHYLLYSHMITHFPWWWVHVFNYYHFECSTKMYVTWKSDSWS